MEFNDLLVIKKSYKKPKEGDVFALNPKKNLYCFGKVIKTNVESRDSFVNGMYLVYIYDIFSEKKELPDEIDLERLMFAPIVINTQLWRKGFAENIGNVDVNGTEINLDYGFWSVGKNKYVNIRGEKIDYVPKYVGTFGLGSYGAIGEEIQKVIADRNL